MSYLTTNPFAYDPFQLSMNPRKEDFHPFPGATPDYSERREIDHCCQAADQSISQFQKNLMALIPNTHFGVGGADRARTDDFRLAKAALSQLSYSPFFPECCLPECSR